MKHIRAVTRPFGRIVCRLFVIAVIASAGCREAVPPPEPRPEPHPAESAPAATEVAQEDIEAFAIDAAREAWWWDRADCPRGMLDDEIAAVTITESRELPAEFANTRAWLVAVFVESATWWKKSADVIVVVQERDGQLRTLLAYAGGYGAALSAEAGAVEWELADLGDARPGVGVMIHDHAKGTGMSQQLTSIYLWDRQHDLSLVFREQTELCVTMDIWWRSEIEFEDGERAYKDVVVKSHFYDEKRSVGEDGDVQIDERLEYDRTSVFTWNGLRYAGEMNLPGEAREALLKWHQPGLPGRARTAPIGDLEFCAVKAAEEAYRTDGKHLSTPSGEETTLKCIEITDTRPYPLPGRKAWLVEAVAEASFWKSTRNVVLVLAETSGVHETLLSYVGGYNCSGQGVSAEIIDLGVEEPAPALRIDDFAHGNQMSHTVMEIFRWDEDTQEMASVLRAHVSHMNGHGVFWDSEVEFHEGYRPLKHVVIESDIWESERRMSDRPETLTVERLWEEHRTSPFTWEGDRYEGEMNFPEKARAVLARFGR